MHCRFPSSRIFIGLRDSPVNFKLSGCPNRGSELTQGTLLTTFDQTIQPTRKWEAMRFSYLTAEEWPIAQIMHATDRAKHSGCPAYPFTRDADEHTTECSHAILGLFGTKGWSIHTRLIINGQSALWRTPGISLSPPCFMEILPERIQIS